MNTQTKIESLRRKLDEAQSLQRQHAAIMAEWQDAVGQLATSAATVDAIEQDAGRKLFAIAARAVGAGIERKAMAIDAGRATGALSRIWFLARLEAGKSAVLRPVVTGSAEHVVPGTALDWTNDDGERLAFTAVYELFRGATKDDTPKPIDDAIARFLANKPRFAIDPTNPDSEMSKLDMAGDAAHWALAFRASLELPAAKLAVPADDHGILVAVLDGAMGRLSMPPMAAPEPPAEVTPQHPFDVLSPTLTGSNGD